MNLNFRSPAAVFLGVFVAALIGCTLGCTLALKFFMSHNSDGPNGHDPHDWLHHQLGLTEEQHAALEEMEGRFEKQETEVRAAIAAGNAKLAIALREDEENTPRVQAIVKEIHHAQAKLQNATIDHLVDMKTVLTPEQFQKLLELAEDALSDF